jgi:hypothetical protein
VAEHRPNVDYGPGEPVRAMFGGTPPASEGPPYVHADADLLAAILARCDELEGLANAAVKTLGGRPQPFWRCSGDAWLYASADPDGPGCAIAQGDDALIVDHLAAWSPTAVLELVAGARKVVTLHWFLAGCVPLSAQTLVALARMLGVSVVDA